MSWEMKQEIHMYVIIPPHTMWGKIVQHHEASEMSQELSDALPYDHVPPQDEL